MKNLPPLLSSFKIVPTTSPDWETEVIKQGEAIKSALLTNYPLAFGSVSGDVSEYAAVKPIQVFINEGAKPINHSTCPRIPPGMEAACQDMIKDLEHQGVIKRFDKATDWCAPARFILKHNGKPRLVINFQGLNSQGTRIGYPFSSVQDIHSKIQNNTLFFIVMDLINSYFQLRIAEESQPLLAFVCPFGKYVMRRVPQGWLAAGDHLNIETRIILQGIDRCAKIIDDTLLMPRTANEAYLMGSKICINAISRNFKFSQTKFRVAPVESPAHWDCSDWS